MLLVAWAGAARGIQAAKENEFPRSLFQRLQLVGLKASLLGMQYRMHPFISAFPRRHFYGMRLTDGRNVADKAYGLPPHVAAEFPGMGPYCFLNVVGLEEKDVGGFSTSGGRVRRHSLRNQLEGVAVLSLLKRLSEGTPKHSTMQCVALVQWNSYSQQLLC